MKQKENNIVKLNNSDKLYERNYNLNDSKKYLKINMKDLNNFKDLIKSFCKNSIISNKPFKKNNDLFYRILNYDLLNSHIKEMQDEIRNKIGIVNEHSISKKQKGIQKEKLPSFDIIGHVAIVSNNIPLELALKIPQKNKNIKTLYQEIGKHDTAFRIQPLKLIYGEDLPETTYKENNTLLKLNVKKVYFSPRLGTERLRIIRQVKPNERIMIMFSGVGPYVYEIAKNTEARFIYGVELNPEAHKYSYINKFLNKATNTLPILGDVKEIMPNLNEVIMGKTIYLKDNVKHLMTNSAILEIKWNINATILKNNIDEEIEKIKTIVNDLISIGKNVFLRMSWDNHFDHLGLSQLYLLIKKIIKAAKSYYFYLIFPKNVFVHLNKFDDKDVAFVEIKINELDDFIKKAKIRNIVINFEEFFEKNNESIEYDKNKNKDLSEILAKIKNLHGFNLIFRLPCLKEYSFKKEEIISILREMNIGLLSDSKEVGYDWIKDYKFHREWFDRIAMPLPLGAENFLDYAIPYVKSDGVIHLYDFISDSEFPRRTIKKFEDYANKYKIKFKVISARKTAEIAPKKYRVCVDFLIRR